MQPQILRVDNIEESIRENGLEFYVDRLIQDRMGEYYWVEAEMVGATDIKEKYSIFSDYKYQHVNLKLDSGWSLIKILMRGDIHVPEEPDGYLQWMQYKICRIPKELAWFCIDAIKLKTQVINLGNGTYGDGPHGGDIQYFIKDGDQFKEIPVKAVRVETL